MYKLSEKVENSVVKECFDDICVNATKEDSGAFKGIVNAIAKSSLYFDEDKNVAVVAQKHVLALNYIYRLDKQTRIQILQKIEEPYIFAIELNGKTIELKCDQYSCKRL